MTVKLKDSMARFIGFLRSFLLWVRNSMNLAMESFNFLRMTKLKDGPLRRAATSAGKKKKEKERKRLFRVRAAWLKVFRKGKTTEVQCTDKAAKKKRR
jgi:hypothetical protein